MKRNLITLIFFCCIHLQLLSQAISPLISGQAYHFASWSNTAFPILFSNTSTGVGTTLWDDVKASGAKLIRIGGNQYNANPGANKPPDDFEVFYVKIIDDIRSNGCEPVLTIPFNCPPNLDNTNPLFIAAVSESVDNAKKIIHLVNVVHKRNLKYVIIANEPGIDYDYETLPSDGVQYAKNVAAYTKPLAQAVKEVDPSIFTIGPECEYYITKVYNKLFDPTLAHADCIAGLIPVGSSAAGLPYIDFASYHYYLYSFQTLDSNGDPNGVVDSDSYPGGPQPYDRDIVYTEIEKYKRTIYDSPDDPKRFRGAMRDLRQKCIAISSARGKTMGWMLTETNSSGHNEAYPATPLGNNPYGMDTRSLLGAQNLARIYSLAMEYGAASVCMWSVHEGCDRPARPQDRGYIDCYTNEKRSSWYHYEAMAQYFNGDFYKDKLLETDIGAPDDIAEPLSPLLDYNGSTIPAVFKSNLNTRMETKAFAAKGENVVVMVLNHSQTAQEFSIRFDGGAIGTFTTGSSTTKKFSFNVPGILASNVEQYFSNIALTAADGKIEAESTLILIFDCYGNLGQTLQYRITNEAQVNNSPFSVRYTASGFTPTSITASVPPATAPCIGQTSTITINGAGSASFKWYKLPSTIEMFGYTSNAASGLTSGAYRTEIVTACATVNLVNVVHHQSPLVDAGPDKSYCSGLDPTTNIGNNFLPSGGPSYSWTTSAFACAPAPPTGTSALSYFPSVSCTTSTQYVMKADDGTCSIMDESYVYINGTDLKDVYIRDSPVDIGNQPNWQTYYEPGDVFWASPDIWNRVYGDGQLDHENPDHQGDCITSNPSYASSGNPTNTIYVRLKNKGCDPVTGDLNVYWSKAGTAMEWDLDWLPGGLCTAYGGCVAQCSDHLLTSSSTSTKSGITLQPNSEIIVAVPWCPQDPDAFDVPSCYANFPATERGHICVMATFNDPTAPPTSPDYLNLAIGSDLWSNTFNYNNVAWKNMEIIQFNTDNLVGDGPTGGIIVRNIEQTNFIKLQLASRADKDGKTILDFAKVRIHVSKNLMKRWKAGGMQGKGIIAINDSVFQITNKDALLDRIFLRYREEEGMAIEVIPFKTMTNNGEKYFTLDVIQSDATVANPNPMGGERYLIEKNYETVPSCFTATQTLSGVIIGSPTVTGDVIITSDILVTSGKTLTFDKATVLIAENTKITVMPGGTLVINSSVLQSLCIGKKWAGIKVKGNPIFLSPLIITNSFITESSSPINVEKAKGVLISNSTFLGDNTGIAITLDRMKDFEISDNTFSNYATGIKTTKTDAAIVKSSILRNIFLDVRIALNFSQDNHTKLDIKCNKFSYTDYAILSDQTLLKDQGVLGEGAGNEFISNSTLANNKLKHTSGNSPKYYYDPSNPITSGMNITTIASTTNPACYTYSFDTSSTLASHMMDPSNPIQESISKKAMDLYAVPNPNNGQASIYFSLGEAMQGELIIMDIYGKIVDRINLNSETSKVDVNYSEFTNGIYMLSIKNSRGEVMNKKMVISK